MPIVADSGPCGQCGEKNSTAATKCRVCGTVLPWVKQAPMTTAAPAQWAVSKSAPKVDAPALGGPIVQIVGGLIFVAGVFLWFGNVLGFFPTFPLAGYITGSIGAAIWRAGSNM